MNACIKTGALVFIDAYGQVYPADIYRVGNCYVIRTNMEPIPEAGPEDATHRLMPGFEGAEFWRPDLGVYVVPEHRLVEVLPPWLEEKK